jgi:methionine sulfoxide reductase heme-binding subunit
MSESTARLAAPRAMPPRPKAARSADLVRYAKPVVILAGLVPVARLAWAVWTGSDLLGANPAETILHQTGDWAVYFLLATLAVTPLRRLTGWNWLIKFRRMLGLFAFFYAVVHFASYIAFDQYFDAAAILRDVWKRPFITVGFAALLLMTPLAITSTKGWIRRLGAPAWNRLHQLVYAVGVLAVVHYWWLVKKDITWPAAYAAILAVLLGWRVWKRLQPREPRRARA